MINIIHSNPEKNNITSFENQEYITDLIQQTLLLRGKYFDDKGNVVDIYPWRSIKNIIKIVLQPDKNIAEDIQITNSDEARKYFEMFQSELVDMFVHFLTLSQHESRNKALWHDSTHAAYDGYEILEYTWWIENGVERLATYFGSLAHDLGRPDEIEFKWWQVNDEHHALYALMYLSQELKNHTTKFYAKNPDIDPTIKKELEKIARAFFRRVANAVIVHSGFNDTRDPVFHHVQSLDRLAGIMGQRFFVRILLADGIHHNKPLYSSQDGDYTEKIPAAWDVSKPYSIFHKTEQYMRGTFHKPVSLSLDTADGLIDERTRQSMAILYFMAWWKNNTSLYQQTFFPELHTIDPQEWDNKAKKWVLPDKYKDLLSEGKLLTDAEKKALANLWDYSVADYCRIMLQQQSMFLEEKDIQHFIDYITSNTADSADQEEYIKDTLRYIIVRRELDRIEEKQRIESNLETKDPFKSILAQNLSKHPLRTQSLEDICKHIQTV